MVFSGTSFYWGITTRISATIAALFSNMTFTRTSPDNIEQVIKVPVHYGMKEKMMARLEVAPGADTQVAMQLPVVSYEVAGWAYAPDRKEVSLSRNVRKITGDKNHFNVQYNSVPYDIFYNVYIYAKTMEDGLKIFEQAIAFFTPDFTVTMTAVPTMVDDRDIPIVLKNVQFEDLGQPDKIAERRMLIWTLQFVAHVFYFGPVRAKPVIKDVIMNLRLDGRIANPEDTEFPPYPSIANDPATNLQIENDIANNAPIASTTEIIPGLDANGNPTFNYSQAIPYQQVDVDDNWAVLVHIVDVREGANGVTANT